MTAPATEPSSENRGRCQSQDEEDEPGREHSVLHRLHRFRWFDRSDRRARDQPLHDVCDDQKLNDDQNGEPQPRISALGDLFTRFLPQLGKSDLFWVF